MKKIIIILVLLALSFVNFNCGGGGSGSSDSPKGENPGTPSNVQVLPSHYIAQTNSYVTIHAKVLDGNGAGVPNTDVKFTNLSPVGVLTSTTMSVLSSTTERTDNLGIATVTLKSNTSGFSTIQAEVNTGVALVRDHKTVFFSSINTSQLTTFLDLSVDGEGDPYILFENTNDNSVIVTATVYNAAVYISGSQITFGADRPYKISSDPDAKCSDGSDTCDVIFPAGNGGITNSLGQASVPVTVVPTTLTSISSTLNIYAQSDTGAFNMVTLFLEPVLVDQVSLSANPQTVKSEETAIISAYVTTTAGTPVPDGTTVNFTASMGAIEPFSQTTNGIAQAKFTAPHVPESYSYSITITAQVGGKQDTVTVLAYAPEGQQ